MWAPMGASMRSASEFLEELALDLAPNKGDRPSQPIMVPLAPAALRKMVHFGRLLQNQKDDAGGLMRSTIGKARGLTLRLSLVLAYLSWCAKDGCDAPPEVIAEEAFLAADGRTSFRRRRLPGHPTATRPRWRAGLRANGRPRSTSGTFNARSGCPGFRLRKQFTRPAKH